jgi:sulfite reductase (NADPH) hemoprotein beta-component
MYVCMFLRIIIGGAPQIIDDDIKVGSNFLRGMITEGLADLTTGKLLPEDTKLTKFHGIYQQDLRSVRDELDAKGLERAYSFMIRVGIPGGVASTEQYIAMDDICDTYANGVLKLTTRQAYQLHGVVKRNLKTTMKEINRYVCMYV